MMEVDRTLVAPKTITVDPVSTNDTSVRVTPLGAGQEVGRSCILLSYRGRNIMFDCGIHPGHEGLASLPLFDHVDLSTVSIALITHFHLDHCAAVPYLIGQSDFKGRLFMTHPTKAIYRTLLSDFLKVSQNSDNQLYSEVDLENSMEKIEVIDFNQTIDIDGIKVCAYRAGHVLGAAMFTVNIDGMIALYTGDYSRIPDRHLPGADLPHIQPNIVIVESTYGVSNHLPRQQRELNFLRKVRGILDRGGNILLPVVALGRAQEMLLMLDEHWESNPELHSTAIYQASGLAMKALTVYQTYIEMMNEEIKRAFQIRNPFNFKFVQHLKSLVGFRDSTPCVVLATPSMLQSGISRELFDLWCADPKHGVIIADFAVQGTLARQILENPTEVSSKEGAKIPLRMSVDAISFSAHADFDQTSQFLDALRPQHVILVHGEANEMGRLRKALERQGSTSGINWSVHSPKVAQTVDVIHEASHIVHVVGNLANKPPSDGRVVSGVLVQENNKSQFMSPSDLEYFSSIRQTHVVHKQVVPFSGSFETLRFSLEVLFEGIQCAEQVTEGQQNVSLSIGDLVHVTYVQTETGGHLLLEWESGNLSDTLADAVIASVLQMSGKEQASQICDAEKERLECLARGDSSGVRIAEMKILADLMKAQYGNAEIDEVKGSVMVKISEEEFVIDSVTGKVEGSNEAIKDRIQKSVDRLKVAFAPIGYQQQSRCN
eukprot:g7579.t1